MSKTSLEMLGPDYHGPFTRGLIDPFTACHKLVHNGGFPKFEVMYCSQNTVKSIKIQENLRIKKL